MAAAVEEKELKRLKKRLLEQAPELPPEFRALLQNGHIVPTKYWHKLPDGRIQCDVCPRFCKLREGQRGLCFVRARVADQIVLTSYGLASGFCIDPIEKKPLYHYLPGTPSLSFGTAGCNLACKFCFPTGTLVATKEGMQLIERLFESCEKKIPYSGGWIGFPEGLEVWTRKAKTAPVTKVFARPYRGELVVLKAMAAPPLKLTPNHKVFAARKDNPAEIRRIKAEELTQDHFLVVPKRWAPGKKVILSTRDLLAQVATGSHRAISHKVAYSELVAALRGGASSGTIAQSLGDHPAYVRKLRGELARGELQAERPRPIQLRTQNGRVRWTGERNGIPEKLELSEPLAWLLGLYCAEGHVSAHPRRPNAFCLVFSVGHHEAELAEKVSRLLWEIFGLKASVRQRRTTLTVVACWSASAARLFAELCGKGAKEKRVPKEVVQTSEKVIRAFLEGYLAGDGYRSPTHLVASTVSERLAYGLYELGLCLDLLPEFEEAEGRYLVKFKRDRFEGRPSPRERAPWRDMGDYFLVPLRQVEQEPYEGMVYNLEVDDPDHAYRAPFLAVSNCQNWDISKSRELERLCERAFPNAIAEAAKHYGCRTVAYTYNDPVIFMEYAIDTAKACEKLGIKSVAVTAGYQTREAVKEFYPYMDAANIDLKAFTERFYHKICGGHLKPVLETIEYVCNKTDVWVELTTLLIPGENDSEKEIRQLSRWVKEHCGPHVPLHLTAFHPDWKMLDKPPTLPQTLIRARQIAMDEGLFYVYTGNIHDPEGDSIYCPGCKKLVIGRDWYLLTEWHLTDRGQCEFCGFKIHGVFEEKPGDWGPRRLVVDMSQFAE